jgi:hypothetical protein
VSGEGVYLRIITGGMCAAHSKGVYMVRIMLIGLSVVGMALPAFADEATKNDSSAAAAFSAELANVANAEQARIQLAHQGFTGISPLYGGEQGRWTGTAVKDGKTVIVGVLLPQAPKALTN